MSKRSFQVSQSSQESYKRQRSFGLSSQKVAQINIMPRPAVRVYKKKSAYKRGKYVKRAPIARFADAGPNKPEVKYIQASTGTFNIGSTGSSVLMNNCIQGSANGNRIGQRIHMTSFEIKGQVANSEANLIASTGYSGDTCSFRVVCVYDKQANGAAPVWSTLYTNTGAGAPFSDRVLSTRDRFTVLWDSGVQSICSSGPNGWSFQKYGKMKLDTNYTTTNNGDITDIISGSLYLIVIDNNTTANLPTEAYFTVRVNYTDE